MFNNFISENRTVGDVGKWQSQTGRRRQHCPCELHPAYLRLQTLKIRNTYCFSIATMVARTRLNYIYTCTAYLVLLRLPLHVNAASVIGLQAVDSAH